MLVPVLQAGQIHLDIMALSDDGDIGADDLKYGVVLDNGAHKIIVKGNDLNLIKVVNS